jgi:hypothetical protein
MVVANFSGIRLLGPQDGWMGMISIVYDTQF